MVLIVVRHGESVWNKENRFTGFKDVALSEKGVNEAKNASKQVNVTVDIAFTSNLMRAIDTCLYIKSGLKQDFDVIKNEALNERDYGDLTGKNKKELADEVGAEQVQIWRRSVKVRPPNGENLIDVIGRVSEYYYSTIKRALEHNENVLVVAHGNSIRALLCVLGVFTVDTIHQFEIPTATPMFIQWPDVTNFHFKNDVVFKSRQILDSRGNPTIEVDCIRNNGEFLGRGTSPSGASTGSNEAVELRDNDERFMGKSVYTALENIKELNNKMYLSNVVLSDCSKCDKQMIALDGTQLKRTYGGNTTTALSFMFADVGAKLNGAELFAYLSKTYGYNTGYKMPIPMVNILNGGKHAGGNLKIQEFMIMPSDTVPFIKRTEYVFTVYHNLKKLLKNTYGPSAINLGDEGGFAPNLKTATEALRMIEEAVHISNLKLGTDIYLALDCAASEYYDKERRMYEIEKNKWISSSELVQYYVDLIKQHPSLKSIEDPFDEKDYEAWKQFTELCGKNIMVVGDDLFTTNPTIIKEGMKNKWANSLLLKVNQIGTISESVEAAKLMQSRGCDVIVSHRSGETNNTLISDLAVGIGAKYIKLGAPARGERVAKYNRLIQIEELLY